MQNLGCYTNSQLEQIYYIEESNPNSLGVVSWSEEMNMN
jgi:hypothetical protein